MSFVERLGSLDGKPAAVFTTYDIAIGKTLTKMAAPLEARGAIVSGRFKSKGPNAADEFDAWLQTLDAQVGSGDRLA
jgi:hypothetical protein